MSKHYSALASDALSNSYVVILRDTAVCPLGQYNFSERLIVEAYSDENAKEKVEAMLKKPFQAIASVTKQYRTLSEYGTHRFSWRERYESEDSTVDLPDALVDAIRADLADELHKVSEYARGLEILLENNDIDYTPQQ